MFGSSAHDDDRPGWRQPVARLKRTGAFWRNLLGNAVANLADPPSLEQLRRDLRMAPRVLGAGLRASARKVRRGVDSAWEWLRGIVPDRDADDSFWRL